MRFKILISSIIFLLFNISADMLSFGKNEEIELVKPSFKDSLTQIINARRSYRNFKNESLTKKEISLILWAAAGKTPIDALSSASRTVPSAGATNPLEIYLVVGKNGVEGIVQGLYHYNIDNHTLELKDSIDKREALSIASLSQGFIIAAPVSLVIVADYNRTASRYGKERGARYVHIEVGHSCQNIYLVSTSLGLGTVEVGAFDDNQVKKVLGLPNNFEPLAIMPVGHIK